MLNQPTGKPDRLIKALSKKSSFRLWAIILLIFSMGNFMSTGKAQEVTPKVLMETSLGVITIELYQNEAPITVENFLRYVDDGFYNGLIFHRVVSNFVIQGGGFTEDMVQERPLPPITNEASNGLLNSRGTLSMARTSDPHSATSQFFINLKDNASLDYQPGASPGYAVFAQVIEGMEVVDKIAALPTTTKGGHRDVPVAAPVIQSITRLP